MIRLYVASPLRRLQAFAFGVAVTTLAMLSTTGSAQAGVTFAEFKVSGVASPGYFSFVKAASGYASTFSGTENVTFTYSDPNIFSGATTTTYTGAIATLNATQSGNGTSVAGITDIPLDGTLAIKDGSTNLLTVSFTGLVLKTGASGASLSADTSNADTVTFTSSVLNQSQLSSISEGGFSIGLTTIAGSSISYNNSQKTFNSFKVVAGGSYTAAVVPEPTSLAMFGTALLIGCGITLRRFRHEEIARV